MATFLLIHGAFHGGWCWENLVPLLEARGHRVLAPDLPGLGRDTTPLGEVDLERWARFVADLAEGEAEPVVMVGHSRGGIVISRAAELAPDAFAGLVYLTAMLVPNGRTMATAAEREGVGAPANLVITPSADGLTLSVDPASCAALLYNTTPPDRVAQAMAQLGPEPAAPFASTLAISDERFGRVPRAYIECSEDLIVTLPLQRAMQRGLPCDPVVTLATDHSPFYSAPEDLAEALDGIARQFSGNVA